MVDNVPHKKKRHEASSGGTVFPFLLTMNGSAFLLRADDAPVLVVTRTVGMGVNVQQSNVAAIQLPGNGSTLYEIDSINAFAVDANSRMVAGVNTFIKGGKTGAVSVRVADGGTRPDTIASAGDFEILSLRRAALPGQPSLPAVTVNIVVTFRQLQ